LLTDRQTNRQKHVPPPLSEVIILEGTENITFSYHKWQ